jgi:hypothetical protein
MFIFNAGVLSPLKAEAVGKTQEYYIRTNKTSPTNNFRVHMRRRIVVELSSVGKVQRFAKISECSISFKHIYICGRILVSDGIFQHHLPTSSQLFIEIPQDVVFHSTRSCFVYKLSIGIEANCKLDIPLHKK